MKQWKSLIQEIKIDSKESEFKNICFISRIIEREIERKDGQANEDRYNMLPVHGWFWNYCHRIRN